MSRCLVRVTGFDGQAARQLTAIGIHGKSDAGSRNTVEGDGESLDF
jgi:hypothetical protein